MSACDDACLATTTPNPHEVICCWGDEGHAGPHGALVTTPFCPTCGGMDKHFTACPAIGGEDPNDGSEALLWDHTGYWIGDVREMPEAPSLHHIEAPAALVAWLNERILPHHTPGKEGYDRGWDHALRMVRAHLTGTDCDSPEHLRGAS